MEKREEGREIRGDRNQKRSELPAQLLKKLNKTHFQGALVRSGASAIMWLIALFSFLFGIFSVDIFIGISAAVVYLILMNPPTLWVLKRTTRNDIYRKCSLLINALEIIGYTAIIYFLGGIRAAYLASLYAALITYVGITAPRSFPFIIASLCGTTFLLMVAMEHLGLIPFQEIEPVLRLPLKNQVSIVLATISSLYVIAYITSYTSHLLKKSKDELRKQNVELVTKTEDLKQAQTQLIQAGKLASIGELASGVAHELNQPLMVIRGTVQLICRSVRRNNLNNDELMEQLDPIERNTKRMMNIINHLQTFSRQSKGEFRRLDFNKVVKGSFTLINEQLRLRNVEVMEAYASDLPPVQGSETRLEQVIINLITNARDAMDRQEENSKGADETKKMLRISTSEARDNSHVEIRITDSGKGIPPGDLDRIFDPFFTTKEVGKGTGLGLSISYGIIKDHGGEIQVTETGPAGTTFRISLPISPTDE